MPALSVMRYMNSVGLIPQLLICDIAFHVRQYPLIVNELNKSKIQYKEIRELPVDYDVMFSEAMGACDFENYWLTESNNRGKTNIMLLNELSIYQHQRSSPYLQKLVNENKVHGICTKIEKTIQHYKKFAGKVFMINTGDPDWDFWQTKEFKNKVKDLRSKFGDKIYVVCENFYQKEKLLPFIDMCIREAEKLGFKIFISTHPDRWGEVPKKYHKYCDRSILHHVLFSAASHVTINITSSVSIENLLLGTKVGCTPAVFNCKTWGDTQWLSKKDWFGIVPKHIDPEILKMFFPIFSSKDLINFLTSTTPIVSIQQVEKLIGRISVPSYSEYLFKTLEQKLKK